MARRKAKQTKTVAQHIVDTAAVALPSPLRSVVASRWGARLTILAIVALLGTGIATLDWSSGRPRLKFDRQRAQEVRHNLRERVDAVVDDQPAAPAQPYQFAEPETPPGERKAIGARIFKDHR